MMGLNNRRCDMANIPDAGAAQQLRKKLEQELAENEKRLAREKKRLEALKKVKELMKGIDDD